MKTRARIAIICTSLLVAICFTGCSLGDLVGPRTSGDNSVQFLVRDHGNPIDGAVVEVPALGVRAHTNAQGVTEYLDTGSLPHVDWTMRYGQIVRQGRFRLQVGLNNVTVNI